MVTKWCSFQNVSCLVLLPCLWHLNWLSFLLYVWCVRVFCEIQRYFLQVCVICLLNFTSMLKMLAIEVEVKWYFEDCHFRLCFFLFGVDFSFFIDYFWNSVWFIFNRFRGRCRDCFYFSIYSLPFALFLKLIFKQISRSFSQ